MEKKIQIIVPAVIACILWGTAFPIAKLGFEYSPPILLSGMRFILAGLLLIPFIIYNNIPFRINLRKWKFLLLFSFMQTFLQYGIFFVALNMVPAPIAAIIIGGAPLFIAVMSHLALKNDKMTLQKSVAIVLGLSGVAFISLAKGSVLAVDNPHFYVGVILLICSNLLGGYTNIMAFKYASDINPIFLTSFANLLGGILLLCVGLVVENPSDIHFSSLGFYPTLLWLSIISAAAFSIWYTQLQKPGVKVSELNMWKFVIPVTGCMLSWVILKDEYPDWMSITGIIIITIALQILQFPVSTTNKVRKLLGLKVNNK